MLWWIMHPTTSMCFDNLFAFCIWLIGAFLIGALITWLVTRRKARAQIQELMVSDAERKGTEAELAIVKNVLMEITSGTDSPLVHLELSPAQAWGVNWRFTITWTIGGDTVRAQGKHHQTNNTIVISHTARGHDLPSHEFGSDGYPPLYTAPACVRQILGLPEPPTAKSQGMCT